VQPSLEGSLLLLFEVKDRSAWPPALGKAVQRLHAVSSDDLLWVVKDVAQLELRRAGRKLAEGFAGGFLPFMGAGSAPIGTKDTFGRAEAVKP
jgi:hypothetical protein